jgi:DNA invertase Pin-like site-specific DNA recombinase
MGKPGMSSVFQAEQQISKFLRCAFYGRYSTDLQRPSSIEAQLLACREFAATKEWEILTEHIYKDEALTGTKKLNRLGLQQLERAAESHPRPFDCVLFDDTSRLGRDQEDVLKFTKVMAFYGIKVCFVSQQLDSSDDNFPVLLNTFAMIDEMYVKRLRVKVFTSQKERVLKGFHVGSVPYGYRSVQIANDSKPDAVGRAATLGSKLEVVDEQAVTVRRIFQDFIDGDAMWAITCRLNQEKVASPQNVRAGRVNSEWSRDAVRHILRNPKYRGEYVWNFSRQTEHPQTGKVKKVIKPAREHVRVELDDLRIIDNELWLKAQARLKKYDDKQVARVLGGYSRAQNGLHLLSGLVDCGHCGSRLRVGGKQGRSVYECPDHRQARGCPNAVRIRESVLIKQLLDALATQMFASGHLDELVEEVYTELQRAWRKQVEGVSKEQIPQVQAEKRKCQAKIDNLIDAIENGAPAQLNVQLQARCSELERLEAKLKAAEGTTKLTTTKEELRALVYQSVENLEGVLNENVALARTVLHTHIKRLRLFSDCTGGKREVFVAGEVDLLCNSSNEKEGVLLGCEGIGCAKGDSSSSK